MSDISRPFSENKEMNVEKPKGISLGIERQSRVNLQLSLLSKETLVPSKPREVGIIELIFFFGKCFDSWE